MTQPTIPTYAHAYAPRNGFGITALVLAITGLVFGLVPLTGFLALILGALAVLFGFLGRGRVRRGEATNPTMTMIGAGFGVLVIALGIWGMTIVSGAVDKFGNDMQHIGQQASPIATDDAPVSSLSTVTGRQLQELANPPAFTAAAAAPAALPTPRDFTITVKTLAKQCFGSAGCVVTYRISPVYVGFSPLAADQALTVVYEVTGGQDGPQINNFTVASGSARYPKEETLQTGSSGTVLVAKVTSVSGS